VSACSTPDESADEGAQPVNSATPTDKATSASADDDGCPVPASVLLAVFTKQGDEYAPTKGFTNLQCEDGYATALQQLQNEGQAEPVTVLFKYSAGTWTFVSAGSSNICNGHGVPTDVQKKFPICAT
jgi:hypothetical protein